MVGLRDSDFMTCAIINHTELTVKNVTVGTYTLLYTFVTLSQDKLQHCTGYRNKTDSSGSHCCFKLH
jgi:hypothetical protein